MDDKKKTTCLREIAAAQEYKVMTLHDDRFTFCMQ